MLEAIEIGLLMKIDFLNEKSIFSWYKREK